MEANKDYIDIITKRPEYKDKPFETKTLIVMGNPYIVQLPIGDKYLHMLASCNIRAKVLRSINTTPPPETRTPQNL